MQKLDKRIEELEIKFSYQQEVIDSLNETITKQWDEIDTLKKITKHLSQSILELKDNETSSPEKDPLPPHY